MRLDAYLARIGYRGAVSPDIATLRGVHRAHALALAYENLDVQLGAPVTRDAAHCFEKIVTRRRGGWCYEMNGLLGWALDEIGFDVTRLAGAVMRDVMGAATIGNHLVLLVRIDGADFIADVGFGDGLIDPAPLQEGPSHGNIFNCRWERIGEGWWRYHNDPRSGGPSFDIHPDIRDDGLLESQCLYLQSDPNSPFVQNAVAQRWREDAHFSMRGRVLRVLSPTTDDKKIIASAEEYVETLKVAFGVDLPQAASLWPKICARHAELFGDAAASA